MSYLKKKDYFFNTEDGLRSTKYFVDRYQAKNILDYGCGYTDLQLDNLSKYDPFVEECKVLPDGKFDLVFCHNVLNQVSIDDLSRTIQKVCDLAEKAVVFNIQFPGMYKLRKSWYIDIMESLNLNIKDTTTIKLEEFEALLGIDLTPRDPSWDLPNLVFYILVEK